MIGIALRYRSGSGFSQHNRMTLRVECYAGAKAGERAGALSTGMMAIWMVMSPLVIAAVYFVLAPLLRRLRRSIAFA